MGRRNEETMEKAGRVCFGLLAAAIVARILWIGHGEGRLAFAAGALAAGLAPGIAGVTIAAWSARRRGRPVSELGITLGGFVPSAAAFAAALWASGEASLDIVMKSVTAGFMILLVILGTWIAARGFPARWGRGDTPGRRAGGEP